MPEREVLLSVTVKWNAFEVSPSLPATVLETVRLPVSGLGSGPGSGSSSFVLVKLASAVTSFVMVPPAPVAVVVYPS